MYMYVYFIKKHGWGLEWVGVVEGVSEGSLPAAVAQWDIRRTGDMEVVGSIPTGSSNVLPYEIFSTVILSCWFKKGSCQFLVKEYWQELVKYLED